MIETTTIRLTLQRLVSSVAAARLAVMVSLLGCDSPSLSQTRLSLGGQVIRLDEVVDIVDCRARMSDCAGHSAMRIGADDPYPHGQKTGRGTLERKRSQSPGFGGHRRTRGWRNRSSSQRRGA
jgi:hypothetical protein